MRCSLQVGDTIDGHEPMNGPANNHEFSDTAQTHFRPKFIVLDGSGNAHVRVVSPAGSNRQCLGMVVLTWTDGRAVSRCNRSSARLRAPGRRHRRHRRGMHAAGALLILPAAAASVTAAIVYPLATLGVIGGLGLAAAAHRHRRWERYREAYRKHRAERDKPRDTPEPPKENA